MTLAVSSFLYPVCTLAPISKNHETFKPTKQFQSEGGFSSTRNRWFCFTAKNMKRKLFGVNFPGNLPGLRRHGLFINPGFDINYGGRLKPPMWTQGSLWEAPWMAFWKERNGVCMKNYGNHWRIIYVIFASRGTTIWFDGQTQETRGSVSPKTLGCFCLFLGVICLARWTADMRSHSLALCVCHCVELIPFKSIWLLMVKCNVLILLNALFGYT